MAVELNEVELETKALSWPEKAKAIIIINQESYNDAAGLLISIADLEREIVAHHKEPKQKAHDAHKAIVAAEKRLLDPLAEAKTIIKRGIGAWEQEQARIQREAQAAIEAEARRLEEEARLKLAAEAEKQGASEETVAEILDTPMPVQVPVAPPPFQRAAGLGASRKPVYRWRVANDKLIPRQYLSINEVAINGVVRSLGSNANIPGIEVYEDVPNISVRGRR